MGLLIGCHVLITGAGSGIGAAVADAVSGAGAAVTLAGRRQVPLDEVAHRLARAVVCVADVTSEADCGRLVAAARAAHGPIDIVIANAGGVTAKPFAKTNRAHWQAVIDVNLTGTYQTVHAALPDLLRPPDLLRHDGNGCPRRIICIASTAALKGYPYVAPYVAAKHGVVGLVRALAAEFAKTPLTVNAVCPGYADTPMFAASIANITAKTGRSADDAASDLLKGNPQGRLIDPREVAETVLWLCSPAARSVTGQAIAISGGEV